MEGGGGRTVQVFGWEFARWETGELFDERIAHQDANIPYLNGVMSHKLRGPADDGGGGLRDPFYICPDEYLLHEGDSSEHRMHAVRDTGRGDPWQDVYS